MIRRSLVLLSTVLCLACIVLWFRSVKVADELTLLTHADSNYVLATHPHGVDLEITTNFRLHPPTWNPVSIDFPREGWSYSRHPWGGLQTVSYAPPQTGHHSDGITLAVDAIDYHWYPPENYFLGLGYESSASSWFNFKQETITQRRTTVALPFWLIVLLTAPPFLLVVRAKVIRLRRQRSNRCINCGYDLRGSLGRCPECGGPAPASQG